jgi:GT2 family glycosyltransferase
MSPPALSASRHRARRQAGIDVVIATYNRPDDLRRLLDTLTVQLETADRVFIIWQGDHSPAVTHPSISLISLSRPNLPRARNRGLRAGNNPIVLFLDDDAVADAKLLRAHERAHALHPEAGCVAGYVDDPLFDPTALTPSYFNERTGQLIQNFSQCRSSPALSAMGANMSYKRPALEAIGGFDERFSGNALWEEIDCTFRLRQSGYQVWFCADARIVHTRSRQGGCRSAHGAAYVFNQFANTAYFACRHAPRQYWRSWIRFWNYRLEYLTRRQILWLRHDPTLLACGFAGACAGIARFLFFGGRGRGAVHSALTSSGERP